MEFEWKAAGPGLHLCAVVTEAGVTWRLMVEQAPDGDRWVWVVWPAHDLSRIAQGVAPDAAEATAAAQAAVRTFTGSGGPEPDGLRRLARPEPAPAAEAGVLVSMLSDVAAEARVEAAPRARAVLRLGRWRAARMWSRPVPAI